MSTTPRARLSAGKVRRAPDGRRRAADRVDATEAVLRPVRSGNAFEGTVERLLTAVKLGLVGDGERLPAERELASRLEVSRMTLREAIRSLRAAGYVESRHGRLGGTFVTYEPTETMKDLRARAAGVSREELHDALALRQALEIGVASVAAKRATSRSERAHLERYLRETAHAKLVGYRRADSRLHLAIAELTGSPSLVAAMADARMRLNDLLDAIPLLEVNLRHSNDQHATIVDAILRQDEETARQATAEHLEGTAALLRGFLG